MFGPGLFGAWRRLNGIYGDGKQWGWETLIQKSDHLAARDGGQSPRNVRRDADPVIRPAVVDIGSNSVRLVIYDSLRRNATVILNEKVECGLGSRLGKTGRLPADAIQMALRSLTRFNIMAEAMGVPFRTP